MDNYLIAKIISYKFLPYNKNIIVRHYGCKCKCKNQNENVDFYPFANIEDSFVKLNISQKLINLMLNKICNIKDELVFILFDIDRQSLCKCICKCMWKKYTKLKFQIINKDYLNYKNTRTVHEKLTFNRLNIIMNITYNLRNKYLEDESGDEYSYSDSYSDIYSDTLQISLNLRD